MCQNVSWGFINPLLRTINVEISEFIDKVYLKAIIIPILNILACSIPKLDLVHADLKDWQQKNKTLYEVFNWIFLMKYPCYLWVSTILTLTLTSKKQFCLLESSVTCQDVLVSGSDGLDLHDARLSSLVGTQKNKTIYIKYILHNKDY